MEVFNVNATEVLAILIGCIFLTTFWAVTSINPIYFIFKMIADWLIRFEAQLRRFNNANK